MSSVTRTYEQIALERPHVCTGCGGKTFLSHSHLIPRSYRKDLEAVKENIQYHCMSQLNNCHARYEGMDAPFLNDFIQNMIYIWNTDKTYFWKKFFKLKDHWEKRLHDFPDKVKHQFLFNRFGELQGKTYERLELITEWNKNLRVEKIS